MATEDTILYQPRAKRRQAKYRGPTSSEDINDVVDELLEDNGDSASAINTLHARTVQNMLTLQTQVHVLTERIQELEGRIDDENYIQAVNGGTLLYTNHFRTSENITFTSFGEERRCRLDPMYGQMTVPFNGATQRFHTVNPATQEINISAGASIVATALDETGASSVTAGTPRNALNGNPTSVWLRQAFFPLYSDVEAVQMQIDVEVPQKFNTLANCLYLIPYPMSTCDIDSILYSTSAADPTIALPTFPAAGVAGAGPLKYFFAPVNITKLRITMTQRHWTEYRDQKLFMYGLQELGVLLVEFDQTNEAAFLDNNSFVVEVQCPAGYTFNDLTDFESTPAYATAGNLTGIYFRFFADANLTVQLWDSWANPALRAAPVNCTAQNMNTLYIVGSLRYLAANQVTPILESLYLRYTVQ